jgi:two-component system chemotaxis sensor kinase CheA
LNRSVRAFMTEVIREFILETSENLAQLDTDLIKLEKSPTDRSTLASVFRTLHSIKGTAGFIGLPKLQTLAHAAENLLSKLRAGEMTFSRPIATCLLQVVDAIRQMIQSVEKDGSEGNGDYSALVTELDRLREAGGHAAPPPPEPVDFNNTIAGPVNGVVLPAPAKTVVPHLDITIVGAASPLAPAVATPPDPVPIAVSAPLAAPTPPVAIPVAAPSPAPAPTAVIAVPAPPATIIAVEPPEEHAAPAESASARSTTVAETSIRVDVGILDKLMNLVGELVLTRNQIMQLSPTFEETGNLSTIQRLNLLTSELQVGVMKTRMQPISTLWSKFPRVVRDLAVACGKKVRFDMEGQGTELDKTILEAIRDPLTHMVRNAVDHGIETPEARLSKGKSAEGRLTLQAFHESGKVVVMIQDDGGGIDPARVREKALRCKLLTPEEAASLTDSQAVNLIFMPGFSTSEQVTQFSGRGVGMDVVRTNVEKIGGTVDVESQLGIGTTVKMKIPLTLAIIPALTVSCAGERFCIPQVNLLELVRVEGEQVSKKIEDVHGAPVYRLRGNLLPIVFLDEQLNLERKRTADSDLLIVVLQADERQLGLVVDTIHDTEEIVVKPLQKQHKSISVFAGATIMGDGQVALILDVMGVAVRAGVISGRRGRGVKESATTAPPEVVRESLLVFSACDGGRMAIPLPSVARLEEFPTSKLEQVGPRCLVQYRGEILPLIDLSGELNRRLNHQAVSVDLKQRELTQVIVFAERESQVGLVVDRIVDIVDEELTSKSQATRPGILFNAVVQGRVTEFPDVSEILRSSAI